MFDFSKKNTSGKYTIGVGVWGSSIGFRRKHERHSGQLEYYNLTKLLCSLDSVKNIVIMGRSDYSRLSDSERLELDPKGKIIDPYLGVKGNGNSEFASKEAELDFLYSKCDHLYKFIEDKKINLDVAYIFSSQGCWTYYTLPGYLYTRKGTRSACLNMTASYAGPLTYFLNMKKIPWFMIGTDVRYVTSKVKIQDVVNLPLEILSQMNGEDRIWNHIPNFPQDEESRKTIILKEDKVPMSYANIEKLDLYDREISHSVSSRPIQCAVVAQQMMPSTVPSHKDPRVQFLKKYVLGTSIPLYGKWDRKEITDYDHYMGFIQSSVLDDLFSKIKYTLLVPSYEDFYDWTTFKIWEMISLGVIPFYDPTVYDRQNLLFPDIKELQVRSSEEFQERMKYYDEHIDEHIALCTILSIEAEKPEKKILKSFNYFLSKHRLNIILE